MPAKKKTTSRAKKTTPRKKVASAKKSAKVKKKVVRKASPSSASAAQRKGPFFSSSTWQPKGFFAPTHSGRVFVLSKKGVKTRQTHVAPAGTATGIVGNLGIPQSRFDKSKKSLKPRYKTIAVKWFK